MKSEKILNGQINKNSLVSSYIFFGSDLQSSYEAARKFAFDLGISDFDIVEIEPEALEKGSKGGIRIVKVRELIRQINLTPGRGKRKLAIIKDADKLNIESANTLLKTLEEPPASSIIILLSCDLKLLPTIISRCQIIKFSDKSKNNGTETDYFFPDLEKENLVKIFSAADTLSKNQKLAEIFEVMLADARATLLQNLGIGAIKKIKTIFQAKKNIALTTNKKLVLENLFLELTM